MYCITFDPETHEAGLRCSDQNLSDVDKQSLYKLLVSEEQKDKTPYFFSVEKNGLGFTITDKFKVLLSSDAYCKFLASLYSNEKMSKEEVISSLSIEAFRLVSHAKVKNPFGNYIVFSEALSGARIGTLVTELSTAYKYLARNEPIILGVSVITPEVLKVIEKSAGFVTTHVGLTSHASVIARGVGIPALFINKEVQIDKTGIRYEGSKIKSGTIVTLDGNDKRLYFNKLDIGATKPDLPKVINEIISQNTDVLLNTERPDEIEKGKQLGVSNIGLLRLEHLVLQTDTLHSFRKYILDHYYGGNEKYEKILKKELRSELAKIFDTVEKGEVTVRLLDPPLHEFFHLTDEDIKRYTSELGLQRKQISKVLENLKETNPMMGLRGSRLMLAFHRLLDLQIEVLRDLHLSYKEVDLRIEIPFIMNAQEGIHLVSRIRDLINGDLKIGVMFEIPSLLYSLEELIPHVDFLSFGTNDLTQFALGLSRDDNATIVHQFIDKGIFSRSPFEIIEQTAVGGIMKEAVAKVKKLNPNLEILVCGEHAGNYESITFFKSIGIDKFSCSVSRITEAKFAALKLVV